MTGSLTPDTDYINAPATLKLVSGSISILDSLGNNAGASTPIPITNWISIHTDANNLPSKWIIGSNVSTVTMTNNDPTTSNGSVWQAYTNNAPAGWAGYLVNVDYDQYVYFIEYPKGMYPGAGCPPATPCNSSTTAAGGLNIPTYSPFNFILNPTNATAANWQVTVDAAPAPAPQPIALSVASTLPGGTVNQSYTGNITVTNGTGPYTVAVTGLPAGITNTNGSITGAPTAAGTYNIQISVTDSLGDTGTAAATIVVAPAICQGKSAILQSTTASKLFMTLANGQKVAYSNVYGSKGTTVFTYNSGISPGTFPIGDIVTYVGNLDASTICVPSSITVDLPAPIAVKNAGKSTIIGVDGISFTITGGGVITTNSSTSIEWNRKNHIFMAGDKVEWEGNTVNGVFVAAIVTLN